MNIRTSAFRGLATLSLVALGLAACEGKDVINIPDPIPPAVEVTVAPTQVTLPVGQTATAGAVVKNSTNQTVTWSSGNAAVASVSGTGVITAVAPGSTVITATSAADATAKGLVSVTVTAPVITLSVLPTTATINSVAPGNTIQLATNVSGSTNQAVTCVSSATGVATVAAGLVTAVAPGQAVITCTSAADANVKASAVITVVPPVVTPVAITLSPATANTTIGGTVQMVALVTGSTNTAVTYASSDITVATVNAAGLVTGVKGGTAVITATAAADATKKATAVITVAGAPPVASISIASVVDHETGNPVVPTDISGQIDVTVNVSAVPENGVMAVVVYVDDIQVCRQNFTNPLGTTQGVATINCPVNTAEYDSVTFVPKFLDGNHIISAKALKVDESVITVATFCPVGGNCFVVFDNDDFMAKIDLAFTKTSGSWNGGVGTATISFVQFTNPAVASLTAGFDHNCDGTPESTFTATGAGAVYTGTFSAANVELSGACITVGGVESATFKYDTKAPVIATAPNVTSNVYYNASKTITATVDDYGVDTEDGNTIIEIRSGTTVVKTGAAGASVTTAGLAETAQNVGYQVWVYGKDALGNEAWYGPYGNFGIDFTAPTVTNTTMYDGAAIATGETVNTMASAVSFCFTYIDTATPPAGPSGFPLNPVHYTIRRHNGGDFSVAADSVANCFDLPMNDTDGYYVVNATISDAAGNAWNMAEYTLLVDDTPPEIGTLTVPTRLDGGQPFTMSALLRDNVDLGQGWASIGYSVAGDLNHLSPYWLVLAEEQLDVYGIASLNKVDTFGEITIPAVIRSITTTDATGRPLAVDSAYTAHVAEYAILDVAGVELGSICPDAVIPIVFNTDLAFTANCRLRSANIGPAFAIANPVVRNWQAVNTGLSGSFILNNNAGLGTLSTFLMATGTTAVDATITGPFQTFLNPFPAGVKFYGIDPYGRAHLLGTGTVGVFDDTNLVTRTWTYKLLNAWPDTWDTLYPGGVFALGVDANGDALVTLIEGEVAP